VAEPVAWETAWDELLDQRFLGLQSRPIGTDRSRGHLEQTRLGPIDVYSLMGNAQRVSRGAAAVRAASRDVAKVSLMTHGGGVFSQGGTETLRVPRAVLDNASKRSNQTSGAGRALYGVLNE
jgi:hypothetical protein